MKPEILEVTKANALKAFNEAEANGKKILSNLFPKHFPIDVKERITTIEDVYADHGVTVEDVMPWQNASTPAKVWLNNEEFLRLLFESLNEGWVADFTNPDQRKVYGWVEFKKDETNPAGFRVVLTDTGWTFTDTVVSSRLCLKNDALWSHVFTHFMPQLIIHYNK